MIHDEREQASPVMPVPSNMAARVDGYAWARDTIGESGGTVYRLHGKAEEPDLYLKHGRDAIADDIVSEMVRLRWLAPHKVAPVVRSFVSNDSEAWLLMDALPGKTAYQLLEEFPDERMIVVDTITNFLRRLHDIPVAQCPFNSDHHLRLALAQKRMDAGLVDTEDFDGERSGCTAQQVWRDMTALLPLTPDPVVTHGDYSLDNLLLRNGDVVGCIDVGRAGIADRYQDLAILWNCLGEFGPEFQVRMLTRYGIYDADERKLRFHLMLDEFF